MRFPDALDAFRTRLLAERAATVRLMADLGEDIRRIVDARQDSNVDDEHDPEGSTIAFERSQSDALLRQSTVRLAEIAAALDRVDAGTFGVCEACGAPIATARLEARPSARLCIECASHPSPPSR